MIELTEIARAKVNLTLDVYGQRADGFHELSSLVAFTNLGDLLTYRPDVPGRLIVEGEFAFRLSNDNLVLDVVAAVKDIKPDVKIGQFTLIKNLPVGAGLGGGSADAAACMRLLKKAHPELLSDSEWWEIARRTGADVPVCLLQKAAKMSGIGEKISILPIFRPVNAVLVNPLVSLSTQVVFEGLAANPFNSKAPNQLKNTNEYRDVIREGILSLESLVEFMSRHPNELESVAVSHVPDIARINSVIAHDANCVIAAMSGSGPTVFGLFRSKEHALVAADQLAGKNANWWIRTVELS